MTWPLLSKGFSEVGQLSTVSVGGPPRGWRMSRWFLLTFSITPAIRSMNVKVI